MRAIARICPSSTATTYFSQWRWDFRALVDACSIAENLGADIVAASHPRPSDYFILKPKHSAFHATPLEILLESLKVKRIYVSDIAADA